MKDLLFVGVILITVCVTISIVTVAFEAWDEHRRRKKNLNNIIKNMERRSWSDPEM